MERKAEETKQTSAFPSTQLPHLTYTSRITSSQLSLLSHAPYPLLIPPSPRSCCHSPPHWSYFNPVIPSRLTTYPLSLSTPQYPHASAFSNTYPFQFLPDTIPYKNCFEFQTRFLQKEIDFKLGPILTQSKLSITIFNHFNFCIRGDEIAKKMK